MSRMVKPLKSASLIITRSKHSQTSFYNYEILMMKRKARPPWGSVLVFPGGLYDPEHDNYLKERFGFASTLEATAVRECFEEAGLFFTDKPVFQVDKLNELGKVRLEYITRCLDDANYKMVSRNYIQKLGTIFAPKTNLTPFLRLITIPQLPTRYDTTFFLHRIQEFKFINFLKYAEHEKYLHESDSIVKCDNEFDKFRWMTPSEIMSEFFARELALAPPQFMMVNVMMGLHRLQDVQDYLGQTYREGDEFGNVSLGPNIVSLIKNTHPNPSSRYKYAATMLGDVQFPYQRHIQGQVCVELREEIKKWSQNREKLEEGKNRFLFNQAKQFFQDDYEVECGLKRSNLRKMMGLVETKGRLDKEYVL